MCRTGHQKGAPNQPWSLCPFWRNSISIGMRLSPSTASQKQWHTLRKFRTCDDAPYLHWLQVNNIHLLETPIWPLE